jgi:hypothetical protein
MVDYTAYNEKAALHISKKVRPDGTCGYLIDNRKDPAYRAWSKYFRDLRLDNQATFLESQLNEKKKYMVPEADPSVFDPTWNF